MSTPASVEARARQAAREYATSEYDQSGVEAVVTQCERQAFVAGYKRSHADHREELERANALLEDAIRNVDEWTPEWAIWRRAVERHLGGQGEETK